MLAFLVKFVSCEVINFILPMMQQQLLKVHAQRAVLFFSRLIICCQLQLITCCDTSGSNSAIVKYSGSCQPITAEFCLEVNWNYTSLPNSRGHNDQDEANIELQHYKLALDELKRCSNYIVEFLCSVYIPYCTEQQTEVGDVVVILRPCRQFCEKVKSDCESTLRENSYIIPPQLECDQFPATQPCLNPTNTTSSTCHESTLSPSMTVSSSTVSLAGAVSSATVSSSTVSPSTASLTGAVSSTATSLTRIMSTSKNVPSTTTSDMVQHTTSTQSINQLPMDKSKPAGDTIPRTTSNLNLEEFESVTDTADYYSSIVDPQETSTMISMTSTTLPSVAANTLVMNPFLLLLTIIITIVAIFYDTLVHMY